MNALNTLEKAKELITHLSEEERKKLLLWLQNEYEEKNLSY